MSVTTKVDIITMFKNCDCLFRAGGGDRLVARSLKHKLQILIRENFILNDLDGTHTTVHGTDLADRWKLSLSALSSATPFDD